MQNNDLYAIGLIWLAVVGITALAHQTPGVPFAAIFGGYYLSKWIILKEED